MSGAQNPMNLLANKSAQDEAHWFITFNDLLTLLLCFFVSTITLGSSGTGNSAGKSEQLEELIPKQELLGERDTPITKNGTAIANKVDAGSGVRTGAGRVWLLSESDFNGLTLSAEATKGLIELSKMEGKALTVTAETCVPGELPVSAAWQLSLERVLALKSQVLDAHFPPELLRLSALGPVCERLGTSESQDTAARITVR